MEIIRCGKGNGRLAQLRFLLGVLLQLFLLRARYRNIHAFAAGWVSFLIPLLGRLLGKRTSFTMTLLDSDDPVHLSGTRFGSLKVRLFQLYDRVIHINPEQARRYETIYGAKDALIAGSVGIDLDYFRPPSPEERAEARRELGLDQDALVAAFSGAVIRRKGIDTAVSLWLHVARVEPRAQFLVLGPLGATSSVEEFIYPELRQGIEGAGLSERIRFLGETSRTAEVKRVLHAADVFLFPSRAEGTPSSVMEAMGCGVVPILMPLDGFTGEIVRDGVEGLVLDPAEPVERLAERVLGLLNDESERRRMAPAARRHIEATHSESVAVAALLQAWDS